MVALWASLDEEHLGQIDRPKLFKFLKSQGLSLRTEADVNVSCKPSLSPETMERKEVADV